MQGSDEGHKNVPTVQRAKEKHKDVLQVRADEQHERVLKEVQRKQNTSEPGVHLVEDEGRQHVGGNLS